jgi:tetratricopeptide (TPR) repeat protein
MIRARIARLIVTLFLFACIQTAFAQTGGKNTSTTKPGKRTSGASSPVKPGVTKKANPSPTANRKKQLSKPLPKGVVQKYAVAMRLFETGKFNDALAAFDAIHRQYPAHEPTIVQYAKTLYRLERIPESYNLFARINPQYLDPETAYEYGYAFYVQNQFEGALYSFKRVPVDHALYDLASYYAAMSAIRLKRYGEAEELLDKAVVLPDKLARNKSLYQKHVTSLRMLQERAELERTTAEEKKRIASDSNQSKNTTQATAAAAPVDSAAPPPPYSHAGFFGVTKLGKITHKRTSELASFHSQSETTYKSDETAFAFSYGPTIPLSFKMDDRQAAIGAQLDLKATNVASEGSKSLLKYNQTSDIIETLVQKSPLDTTRKGDIGGNMWIEYPMPSGMWIGLDGHLSFTYPNFARGQRYGARGLYAQLAWLKGGPTTWIGTLGGSYDLIVDSETEPFLASSSIDGSISAKLPSSSTITAGGRYGLLENLLPQAGVPGPEASVNAFLSLRQDFPLGMSLTATGSAEKKELYTAKDPETGNLVSTADANTLTGSVKFGAAPLSWLAFSASYRFSKNYWTIHNKARKERFEAITPSDESATELNGSLNFTF